MNTSTQELNKMIIDPTKGRAVLINKCSREGLIAFPEMQEMYDTAYQEYSPDPAIISRLKVLSADKKIIIVLGTWCSDSKQHIPHFLKITDTLDIGEENITFIGVDGYKNAEGGLLDMLEIEKVPTFIFYDRNKETGRIIEFPLTTLEDDMLFILNK